MSAIDLRQTIYQQLQDAAIKLMEIGKYPEVDLPEFVIEVPKEKEHGDFASNLAMILARPWRKSPKMIAEDLIAHLPANALVAKAVVAGPGFINLFLAKNWLEPILQGILKQPTAYGDHASQNQSILLEFVSANPTGPLNVVSARAAAIGDTLARILTAYGYQVQREFYVNDAGVQVNRLARSVLARMQGQPVPEDGYPGEYIQEIADHFIAENGMEVLNLPEADQWVMVSRFAVADMVAGQMQVLSTYRVHFDRFFHERDLYPKAVEDVLTELQAKGHTYEEDGALWLKTTDFGDDKDRVLVKQNGEKTYFVPDIAYHRNKRSRADHLIDLLGPDHHGYVARIRGAMQSLGYEKESLEVVIVQLVRLLRAGELVRMSKRGGDFIAMDEFIDEVGVDAARFFFLMRSADAIMDFDMNLAQVQTNENPVFYVQYAHARITSILRQHTFLGQVHFARLEESEEMDLLSKLAFFPREIELAAMNRQPHRISRYVLDLAGMFHSFYNKHRVITADEELTQARLGLIQAVQHVLHKGLYLLGVSAPDKM